MIRPENVNPFFDSKRFTDDYLSVLNELNAERWAIHRRRRVRSRGYAVPEDGFTPHAIAWEMATRLAETREIIKKDRSQNWLTGLSRA